MYLIDTNILIYHLDNVATATLLLDRLFDSGSALSSISYAEIVEGLQGKRYSQVIDQRLADLVANMRFLPVDKAEAIMFAEIRHVLREQGRSVRPRALDLLIAATALVHDLVLVTNDPSDYDDVPGLRIVAADIHV